MDPGVPVSGSFATPLVGNFTDDNGDGAIDLCDTPDLLVTAISTFDLSGNPNVEAGGYVYMLAGDTGVEELKFPAVIDAFVYPAFGDIDGDALPELLTADIDGRLMAFAHDGAVEWTSPVVGGYRTSLASAQCTAIGIYDLNADGAPEILFGWEVSPVLVALRTSTSSEPMRCAFPAWGRRRGTDRPLVRAGEARNSTHERFGAGVVLASRLRPVA